MDCPKGVTTLDDISKDNLVEILACVPFRSLCVCNCVSPAWRDLIADPLLRKKFAQTLEGFFHNIDHRPHGDGNGNDQGGGNNPPRRGLMDFVSLPGRSVPLVDPSFSFLPGIENLRFLDSCNGLLLFVRDYYSVEPSYIVCNPATGQWVTVPHSNCNWLPPPDTFEGFDTYFVFDPVVSPHFHLVQFSIEEVMGATAVNTYSSKTGAWTHNETDWIVEENQGQGQGNRWRYRQWFPVTEKKSAVIKSMLYMITDSGEDDQLLEGDHIVELDVNGKTQRIFPVPFSVRKGKCSVMSDYLGQSQGHLYYINHEEQRIDYDTSSELSDDVDVDGGSYELFIWVLKEGGQDEFVLKDKVSFLHLFGEKTCQGGIDFKVIGIHPHGDLVFFVWRQTEKPTLISYDMVRKEVFALLSLNDGYGFVPYVPCFSESLKLTNRQ